MAFVEPVDLEANGIKLVPLSLAHEDGLQILEALRLAGQLLAHPLDGARLIADKETELLELRDGRALAVILGHLVGEKAHPVAFGVALRQPRQELARRHGDR